MACAWDHPAWVPAGFPRSHGSRSGLTQPQRRGDTPGSGSSWLCEHKHKLAHSGDPRAHREWGARGRVGRVSGPSGTRGSHRCSSFSCRAMTPLTAPFHLQTALRGTEKLPGVPKATRAARWRSRHPGRPHSAPLPARGVAPGVPRAGPGVPLPGVVRVRTRDPAADRRRPVTPYSYLLKPASLTFPSLPASLPSGSSLTFCAQGRTELTFT